jgi:hypothetical protein
MRSGGAGQGFARERGDQLGALWSVALLDAAAYQDHGRVGGGRNQNRDVLGGVELRVILEWALA